MRISMEAAKTLKPNPSPRSQDRCNSSPLKTPSGFMAGAYQMLTEEGELFNVHIPPFSLDSPHDKHAIN